MDVFQEYRPIRNKIALLSVENALGVIWAYGQYLQIDHFQFPKEIEVANSIFNWTFHNNGYRNGSLNSWRRR
jgi:hypothetical protein